MSVKGYTNTRSDKPPDYYSVESSEIVSQSRVTRSSKPTELYENSPTQALRRLSGKFKKLTFKDSAKHMRPSSSSSTLSSEADQDLEDSVFPSPKAESYELCSGTEKSKIDVIYTDKELVVDTLTDTVIPTSLPLTLPSAPSPAHSVAHEEVSDTTHALGGVVLPTDSIADSIVHEVSDITHAISGVLVTDFDTGFTTPSTTVATLYTVPSYIKHLHTVATTVTTTVTSPSVAITTTPTSVVSSVAVTNVLTSSTVAGPVTTTVTSSTVAGTVVTTVTSPAVVGTSSIVAGTATVTTVSSIATPIISVDLGLCAGPSSSISVLYTGPFVSTVTPTATVAVDDIGDDEDESDYHLEVLADDSVGDETDSITDNPDAVDSTDAVDNADEFDDVAGSIHGDEVEIVDSDDNQSVHESDTEMDSFNPSPFRGTTTEDAEAWLRRFNNFCTYRV